MGTNQQQKRMLPGIAVLLVYLVWGAAPCGADSLPAQDLSALKHGQVSNPQQVIWLGNYMNRCIRSVLQGVPTKTDPYRRAYASFGDALCRLKRCYLQGVVASLLPEMSANPSAGGSSSPESRRGAQQQAQALLTALSQDARCADGAGLDPALAAAVQGGI